MLNPQLVAFFGAQLLEGPCWIPELGQLLCVSIEQEMIYLIEVDSGHVQSIRTDGPVGCAVYKGGGVLWSAEKNGVFATNIHTGRRELLVHPEPRSDMRYNDGSLDFSGRFIFGTMGYKHLKPGQGRVFSYDGHNVNEIISDVTISNGIAFSHNGKYMYFIDTPSKAVAKYAYCHETGEVDFIDRVIYFKGVGMPDGMCVDKNGFLWIAEWEGGRVGKWDPNSGNLIDFVEMPCKRVTSCTFGGEHGNKLFITTAMSGADKSGLGGGLFVVDLD